MEMKFKLGDELKDAVTGASGIVMAIMLYYTGCIHYGLSGRKQKKDGGDPDWQWYDETRLTWMGKRLRLPGHESGKATSGSFPKPPQGR